MTRRYLDLPPLALNRRQQKLVKEYQPLVVILAGYFLSHRPTWQRSVWRDELQGDGNLALCKASRTYDPARLPYPKAYFARAILNSMLKSIKKLSRQPRSNRISIEQAEKLVSYTQPVDYLRLAIEALPVSDRAVATSRFLDLQTLRTISHDHSIDLRAASIKARRLAKTLASQLDIQLPSISAETKDPKSSSSLSHACVESISARPR